jgi:two-component system, OmpR family, response regulator
MEGSTNSGIGILIVDDDDKVSNMLKGYLSSEGFQAIAVSNGRELREQLKVEQIDLVLLDLGLPGEDGLTLARELRSMSNIGIIMLTGRGDVIDRVVGIEIGADDYIAKPFHLRELLARIKAVLRRMHRGNEAGEGGNGMDGSVFAFGNWKLFLNQRRLVNAEGHDVVLTSGEFDMLAAFVRNAGRVLSRDQLLDITRGQGWAAVDRTIDTQIARLRKKIEPDTRRPVLIKSVRGVGYLFAAKVRSND